MLFTCDCCKMRVSYGNLEQHPRDCRKFLCHYHKEYFSLNQKYLHLGCDRKANTNRRGQNARRSLSDLQDGASIAAQVADAARRGSGPVQRELNGREIGVVEVAAGIVRRDRGAQGGGTGGAQGVGGGGGDHRGDGGANGGDGGGANAAVIVTDGGREGQQGGGTVNARGKTMEERKSLLKRDPVPRNLAINIKERRNSFWDHTPSFFSLYMMWIISFNTLKRDANEDFESKFWHDVGNCGANFILLLAMLFCNFVGNEDFPSSENGFFRCISVLFHQGSQITLGTTALAAILPSIPSFYAVYQGQEAYIENEGFSGETPFFASFGFYIIAGALLIETARRFRGTVQTRTDSQSDP